MRIESKLKGKETVGKKWNDLFSQKVKCDSGSTGQLCAGTPVMRVRESSK